MGEAEGCPDSDVSACSVVRWTGALGFASIILQLLALILFFAAGIPPVARLYK
jgi:hypothetical protein